MIDAFTTATLLIELTRAAEKSRAALAPPRDCAVDSGAEEDLACVPPAAFVPGP